MDLQRSKVAAALLLSSLLVLPPLARADETPAASTVPSNERLPRALWSTGDDSAALAPIGITDSRTLPAGGFAFSYRYMLVRYDGIIDGTHGVSTSKVLQTYDETPRNRDQQVHLFGVSYAPLQRLTLSAKVPLLTQRTKLTGGTPPANFHTESTGVGDLELRALVPFMRNRNQSLQVEMGFSVPTGSISEHGKSANGTTKLLSIPQQLGSGTVDLLPGLVYRGRWQDFSWGFVARGTFHLYENSKDYRLGNDYQLAGWIAQSWTDWMSTSLRLSWSRRESVHPENDTTVNPEDDPKRQADDYIDIGPGVNFRVPFLGGPRFGVEMTFPFFQSVDGPQLERDWQVTAGWQWAF